MKKTMKLFVVFAAVACTVVMFNNNASAQEPTHPNDPATDTAVLNNTDAILSLAGRLTALKTQIAEVEKKCQSATGSAKRKLDKQLEELKKEMEELRKKADCSLYTGPAQEQCLKLSPEGTNQRLIEAYEATLNGRPSIVETNADNSKIVTYPAAQPDAIDNGGSETITIAEGPNGSFKQVKRVRYQPIPTQFPSVVKDDESDATSWILWTGGGALAGAAIGGGIGKIADPTYHGPLSWDDGGGMPGALIGAGTGAVFGAIMKVATD